MMNPKSAKDRPLVLAEALKIVVEDKTPTRKNRQKKIHGGFAS
jgi:hypothetical protein